MTTIRAAAGGLTSLAFAAVMATLATPASAADAAPGEFALHRFEPAEMQAARLAHLAALRRAGASSALDTTAPKLTAFSVAPTANVSVAPGGLTITMTATDNDTGINYGYAILAGPSGQTLWAPLYQGMPLRTVNAKSLQVLSPFAEPGTWSVLYVGLQDYEGNFAYVSGDELDALGNSHFTVTSRGQGDKIAPTLVGGKVVNTTVSISGHQRDTNAAPWTGTILVGQDSGATISGIQYAYAWYCTLDRLSCFSLSGTASTLATAQPVSVGAYSSIQSWNAPGEYHLDSVTLQDRAGNFSTFTSTEFGGTTDFSTLFTGGTTITLTP